MSEDTYLGRGEMNAPVFAALAGDVGHGHLELSDAEIDNERTARYVANRRASSGVSSS